MENTISLADIPAFSRSNGYPQTVISPLTGRPATLVRTFQTEPSIELYKTRFGYDPTADFQGLDEIALYRDDTGFRFFYPLNLAGPEALYRALEKFDFNYQEGKWEHRLSLKYVQDKDRVLDVGCGEGAFLNQARKVVGPVGTVTGLELNRSAAAKAMANGIEIWPELSNQHATLRPGHYDVVTAFQVIEHVADPKAFMQSLIDSTRPGGTIIVGVPNCDSFQAFDDGNVLNQPPHHVGWWNRPSLEALGAEFAQLLPLTFETATLADEPDIQPWYLSIVRERHVPKGKVLRWCYYRLGIAKRVQRFIADHAHTIAGHTMLAVYRKAG